MRVAEAQWIAARLAEHDPAALSPFLNVGSSTAEFRERKQPHIDRLIFAPLRAAGIEIIHADLKHAPGVDLAGDILDPAVQDAMRRRAPRAVLSSNLLEHVHEPAAFARVIGSLVAPRGLVVVTVPRSYPYHADPIDTGFRPTPAELAALFPEARLVHGNIIEDCTYAAELRAQPLRKTVRALAGALRPRGEVARGQRDRLRWLFRPFSTSCVVLERQ